MLLTEHLSNPSYPLRRLCDQDIRGLIEFKAGTADRSSKPRISPHPMLRQLKPHEVDEMVEAYKAGGTPNELAGRFRVHRTTVMANLRRRGVTIREAVPAMSAADVEEAADLYLDGWSLSQLGAKFRVSDRTVANRLKKAGVILRPPTGK